MLEHYMHHILPVQNIKWILSYAWATVENVCWSVIDNEALLNGSVVWYGTSKLAS